MKKLFILLIIFVINLMTLKAQRIYYAPIEKELYLSSAFTHIIGKINNHILIWKYNVNFHRTTLMIYDEHMRLLKNVGVNIFIPGNIFRINFIKKSNSFNVIYQYFLNKEFFCKTMTVSENGEIIRPPVTLQNSKIVNQAGSEFFDCVVSENNQRVNLYKMRIDTGMNNLFLEFIQFDKNMDSAQLKINYVPLVNKSSYVINPELDNLGNMIFFELSVEPSGNSILNIFKIEKDTDTLLVATNKWVGNIISDIKLTIDNSTNQYLITGIFGKENYQNNILEAYTPTGLFIYFVNHDLSADPHKNFTSFASMPGLENNMSNQHNIYISRVQKCIDGSFMITCNNQISSGKFAHVYPLVDKREPNLAVPYSYYAPVDTGALKTGTLNKFDNPYPSYGPETVPLLQTSVTYNDNFTRTPIPRYNYNPFNEESDKLNKLLILKISKDKSVKWGRLLTPSIETGFISHVEFNASIIIDNNVHYIYPRLLKKDAPILGDALVKDDSTLIINNVIAAVVNYRFGLNQGVQVDERSIVFPCEVKQRLSFAKIEF